MSRLTSSDDSVRADGRHGQTRDGGDHTAEKDDHDSQTCVNARARKLEKP